jgi:hypothetical protein
MFGTRLIALIIALLLATHAIQPSDGWFIAIAVLLTLSLIRSLVFLPLTVVRWTLGDIRRSSWGRGWQRRRWADEWWS